MNKNNNKMDLLGNAPVPQALMALGIPIMIGIPRCLLTLSTIWWMLIS